MKSSNCYTSMALLLMLVVSLCKPCSGQWQVFGPDKLIRVSVGETATFSCFLSPETNAETMEVRFFKNQFDDVVHLYRDRKDQENMRMPEYRRRTELVKDSLDRGHATLRLQKVTLSDAGLYGCWFKSQTHEQEAIWELQVAEMGSTPLISIMGYIDGGIQLRCQSSGWLFQPIVKWKGPEGLKLPTLFKVNKDVHGQFDVETSLTVQENSGIISCSMQLTDQSPEVKSRIFIGKTFFQISHWLPVSIVLMLLCIGGCVCIIVMTILLFKLKGKLEDELEFEKILRLAEWRKVQTCSVKVTLDPDTAHPQLSISDLNTVTYRNAPQEVAFSEKRFVTKCVVASQGFKEGRHYWEVDIEYNRSWHVGVCRDDVDRKKDMTLSPINGYWVLGQETESLYFVNNPNRIHFSLTTNPTRVGIFLNYNAGILSFFNTDDHTLIFTLTCQFEGLLRPFIEHSPSDEENVTPIFICSVLQRKKPVF